MNRAGLRKRVDRALRQVQRQHRELAQLEAELRTAVDRHDGDAIAMWLARYRTGLDAHFSIEEEHLFPALGLMDANARSEVRELCEQHLRLRDDLSGLESTSNAYAIASGLAALHVRISDHERKEESLVLGVLAREADPEASQASGSTSR